MKTENQVIKTAIQSLHEATTVIVEALREDLQDKRLYKHWEDKQTELINKTFEFTKTICPDPILQLEVLLKLFLKIENQRPGVLYLCTAAEMHTEKERLLQQHYKEEADTLFQVTYEILYPYKTTSRGKSDWIMNC